MRFRKLWLFSSLALSMALAGCAKHEPRTTAELLGRLPVEDAWVARIDVDALRKAGVLNLLSAGKAAVEGEYQTFLNGTGFDYQRDLDEVVGSFSGAGTFLVLKGRFDWPRLEAYAGKNGGSCYDKLCRMPGSVPERRISFVPLSNSVMAMAVSTDDLAASRMLKASAGVKASPSQPLWVTVPGRILRSSTALPVATRIFTAALGPSDLVSFTLGPAADGGYEAKLNAQCRTAEDARVMTVQLTKLTEMLKGFLGKSKGEDFGSLIAAGGFSQSGTNVYGTWPVRKGLLESLAGGN